MVPTLALLSVLPAVLGASLWVDTTPQAPKPYAVKKNHGIPLGGGDSWNFFPVTGNSSGKAFTLMITNGPGIGTISAPGLFPHLHKKTYENFYASKGRVQLWGQNFDSWKANTSVQQTRILTQGDFGGIPTNTMHTFNLLDPDTTLTGCLVPGGFEEFFFAMAGGFANGTAGGFNLSDLPRWDVYPQFDFVPRTDVVNNKGGAGTWYDGKNDLPPGDKQPVWIAKNYGPKWINSAHNSYQIVAPLVTGNQTNNWFSQGHITMSEKLKTGDVPKTVSPQATAFLLEEGQLAVTVEGYDTAHLIEGDVVFVPANTTFEYHAEADFTKFMYVTGGGNGLDATLIKEGTSYNSAFYPHQTGTVAKRGFKI